MSFPPISKIFNIHDVHVIVMVLMLLPPLLFSSTSPAAAMNEFFPYERDALIQLRDIVNSSTAANLHGNWTGPPCYKNQSRWAGIGCSNSHVTRLVLEGLHLTASLPPMLLQNVTFLTKLSFRNNSLYGPLPNLSNLLDLEYLFLSHNQFSGSIPIAYAQLPKLTKLELQDNSLQGSIPPFDQDKLIAFNVSHNQLDGPIPETPTLERFPKSSYDYNSNLCGSPLQVPCPVSTPPPPPPFIPPPQPAENKKGSLKIWGIALIAAAAALVPLSIMLFFLCYYRRIHKAMVECGPVVAVKRFKGMNDLRDKEFIQQLQLLGKLRHQNLVELISFYYSKDEKLIIYEYVSHGNLFQLLHENRGIGRQPLNWITRLSIIKDIAKALNFLHQSLPSHKVPHGNLKSSNVLLQHNQVDPGEEGGHYHCKLTDYGLLPLLPSRKSSQKLAVGKSPEFCQGKKLTAKADIYSFGIVLLEIITGKIPPAAGQNPSSESDMVDDLSDWVRNVVNSDWSTDILDMEILAEKDGYDEMLKLTKIALECTVTAPEMRPKMSEVLTRIVEVDTRSS